MTDIIYKTNGGVTEISPKNGTYYTLKELQEIVGGNREILHLKGICNKFMIINEEGKLNKLPYNENATILYKLSLNTDDFIVGDALVCDKSKII